MPETIDSRGKYCSVDLTLLTQGIAPTRRAQTPGRQHHRLAPVGSRVQNGFHTAQQGNRCSSARWRALRSHDHHGIAFVQISQRTVGIRLSIC